MRVVKGRTVSTWTTKSGKTEKDWMAELDCICIEQDDEDEDYSDTE